MARRGPPLKRRARAVVSPEKKDQTKRNGEVSARSQRGKGPVGVGGERAGGERVGGERAGGERAGGGGGGVDGRPPSRKWLTARSRSQSEAMRWGTASASVGMEVTARKVAKAEVCDGVRSRSGALSDRGSCTMAEGGGGDGGMHGKVGMMRGLDGRRCR